MERIYFDNAATSFPKPAGVTEAMVRYAESVGASAGRGAYAEARESGRIIAECRSRLCALINGESADHVIFTLNCSDALNLVIHGVAAHHRQHESPMHVVTTWMEHNSVLRPLNELAKHSMVEQTRVKCNARTGLVDVREIESAIRLNTKLVAVIHGSNVTGTLQPIAQIGEMCRRRGVPLLVDAAQSAGHVPIDVQAMQIDYLAMPGHKGLLGPLGTGVLYIRPGLQQQLATIREGGTGSVSELDTQPEFMPDRFEPGSHNAIGIAGLSEGVNWLFERSVEFIRAHEEQLMRTMIEGLRDMPDSLRWYGPAEISNRCGVFSVTIDGLSPNDLAARLEAEFNLLTRPGLHCAPLAHQTIGTTERGGTVRFSFGAFTTTEQVERAIMALREMARGVASNRGEVKVARESEETRTIPSGLSGL